MKKVISALLVLMMCLAMATNAFAAEGEFVPSISYKDSPEMNSAMTDGEDALSVLVITSIMDAQNGAGDVSDEAVKLLLDVYAKLMDGTMKLSLEKNYVIRDMFDLSFTESYIASNGSLVQKLERDDVSIHVTFNLGTEVPAGFVVMHYDQNEWKKLPVVDNKDGTITVEFPHFCPVVFAVEDAGSSDTADFFGAELWIGLLGLSAVAMVVVICKRRQIFA